MNSNCPLFHRSCLGPPYFHHLSALVYRTFASFCKMFANAPNLHLFACFGALKLSSTLRPGTCKEVSGVSLGAEDGHSARKLVFLPSAFSHCQIFLSKNVLAFFFLLSENPQKKMFCVFFYKKRAGQNPKD